MKKLTKSVLAVVLTASFTVSYAQKGKVDSTKTKDIEGVVVTALGIKREKKAIGYSVSQVGGNDIQKSGESNIIQGLAGKVAGVQVTGTAGTPGASSRIVIRGQKSILLSSQPLIVLDGQIIDNSYNNNAGSGTNIGGVDDSNRAVDINPDDIELLEAAGVPEFPEQVNVTVKTI